MTGSEHALQVGDRVRIFGGYDYDPPWLHGGPGYWGTVERFIPGGHEQPAAVVRLDEEITVDDVRGQVVVLELAWGGTDWATRRPRIHVELCDFDPESRPWRERRHGLWVESHGMYELAE